MAISWGRFDTRTIVLIPIAMAINIVLGQTVASVLKVPIYMDSIGTILVGVLAGPIPGLVTGVLTNLVWTYVIPAPFHSDFAAPFASSRRGSGCSRASPPSGASSAAGRTRAGGRSPAPRCWSSSSSAAIGYYGFLPFYTDGNFTFFGDTSDAAPVFVLFGYLIAIGIIAAIVGLIVLLVVRRDIGVAYVAIAGLICGIVSAIISAPIAAGRLRWRDRVRHGPPRRRIPAGRLRSPDGRPPAGTALRPDRQDAHVLHRLRPAPDPVATVRGTVPAR